jgi:hypothetical protein
LIAAARVANGAHWLSADWFVPMELGLGAALAFTAAYFMRANRVLGAIVGVAFALGATFAPIATFLVWAWIHNLTPMGFVAEITEGEERRRWMLVLGIPFFVLPAIVATGAFNDLASLVLANPALQTMSMFDAGERPLLSFLPQGSSDLNLFSAAVVAQSMHYAAGGKAGDGCARNHRAVAELARVRGCGRRRRGGRFRHLRGELYRRARGLRCCGGDPRVGRIADPSARLGAGLHASA